MAVAKSRKARAARRRLDEGSFLLRHLEISRALAAKHLDEVVAALPPVDQSSARGWA